MSSYLPEPGHPQPRGNLIASQVLGVISLARGHRPRLASEQLPGGCPAVGMGESAAGEGGFDAIAHLSLARRLGREEDSDLHLIADPLSATVVRGQRARRVVVPRSA